MQNRLHEVTKKGIPFTRTQNTSEGLTNTAKHLGLKWKLFNKGALNFETSKSRSLIYALLHVHVIRCEPLYSQHRFIYHHLHNNTYI